MLAAAGLDQRLEKEKKMLAAAGLDPRLEENKIPKAPDDSRLNGHSVRYGEYIFLRYVFTQTKIVILPRTV